MIVVFCCCCLAKSGKKNAGEAQNPTIEIVPSSQRLLPGHQPVAFPTGSRTHSRVSLVDAYLDSNNVMIYPSNNQSSPSNASHAYTPCAVEADTPPPCVQHVGDHDTRPPPPCVQHVGDHDTRPPPPTYESLFASSQHPLLDVTPSRF